MKKSIKYAGIAAATLLAVAPVAAPVVSSTTTVQASTTSDVDAAQKALDAAKAKEAAAQNENLSDAKNVVATAEQNLANAKAALTDTDYTQMTNEAKDFKGQFNDVDNSTAIQTALNNMGSTSYFGEKNAGNIADVQANANVQALMDSVKANINLDVLTSLNTKVYFTATDAKGKTYNGTSVGQRPSDIAAALKLDNRLPMTITVHMNNDALTSLPSEYQTFTFNINKTSDNELKTINAKYTTPISVAKNSKTAATQLVDTDSVVLNDQDGNSTAVSNVTFGTKFYAKYSDALNGTNAITGDNIKDGEFKTAGTYYQTVTYTAATDSALANFLSTYANDNSVDSDYAIYVNGKKASAGYDYTTNSKNGQQITFVRAINVSDSTAEWTTEDITGVVTTKNDHASYTLKNGNNNTVSDRALGANTAWKTNAKRTDQDGNVQYRVGADEWIDAASVTYSKDANNNNNGSDEGQYTNVKALNGKITTAGPAGYLYPLYNDEGKMISDRAVGGLTSWYTDKSATNADGVTVYHVATGEWIQGTHATYTAY